MAKVDVAKLRGVVSRLYTDKKNRDIQLSKFMHLVINEPEVHEFRWVITSDVVKSMLDALNKGTDITAESKPKVLKGGNPEDDAKIYQTALSILKTNQSYNILELKQGLLGAGIDITNEQAASIYYEVFDELTDGKKEKTHVVPKPINEDSKRAAEPVTPKRKYTKRVTHEDLEAMQGPKPAEPVSEPTKLSATGNEILNSIREMIDEIKRLKQENKEQRQYIEKLVKRHKIIDDKYIELCNKERADTLNKVDFELSKGPDTTLNER